MITASKQVLLTEDCIPKRYVQPEAMTDSGTAYTRFRADDRCLGKAVRFRVSGHVWEVRTARVASVR